MSGTARIAIIGRPGTGTSFVATQLASALGAERISFEREVCKVAEQVSGREIDRMCSADREMLINIGTRWGLNGTVVDASLEARLAEFWTHAHGEPDIWLKAVDRTIAGISPNTPLVLDALGSIDEILFLLDRDFRVFRVFCTPDAYRRRLRQQEGFRAIDSGHKSDFSEIFSKSVLAPGPLPTLWNDLPYERGKIRELEPLGMFMVLEDLIAALRNDVRDGMLSTEGNVAQWQGFINELKTQCDYGLPEYDCGLAE